MFYFAKLQKNIEVEPKDLRVNIKEHLDLRIASEVEGTCDESVGCVIALHSILSVGQGKIQYGRGSAIFPVNFQCIVWLPKVGEVIDAIVVEVLQNAVLASAGPVKIVLNYKKLSLGVGSRLDYVNGVRTLSSAKHGWSISPGNEVRIKVLGCRRVTTDVNETLLCVGSIDGEYLGPLIAADNDKLK
jgi:DNA-directed RNA polymerase subunit E'/Rpb7